MSRWQGEGGTQPTLWPILKVNIAAVTAGNGAGNGES
jgi:hypothetical protein